MRTACALARLAAGQRLFCRPRMLVAQPDRRGKADEPRRGRTSTLTRGAHRERSYPWEASVPDDQAQIRELLTGMAAAHRAKDAAQIVASYAPDIVLYSLAPPLRSHRGDLLDIGGGRKADMTTAEGVQRWLDGFGDAPFDYEIRDLEVAAGGDAAYAHGLARMGLGGRVQHVVQDHVRPAQGRGPVADHPPPRVRAVQHGPHLQGSHRPPALNRQSRASELFGTAASNTAGRDPLTRQPDQGAFDGSHSVRSARHA